VHPWLSENSRSGPRKWHLQTPLTWRLSFRSGELSLTQVLLPLCSDSLIDPPALGCQYGKPSHPPQRRRHQSDCNCAREREVAKDRLVALAADQLRPTPPAWVTRRPRWFFPLIAKCFPSAHQHHQLLAAGDAGEQPRFACSMALVLVKQGLTTAVNSAACWLWDRAGRRQAPGCPSHPSHRFTSRPSNAPEFPGGKAHRQFAGIGTIVSTCHIAVEYLLS